MGRVQLRRKGDMAQQSARGGVTHYWRAEPSRHLYVYIRGGRPRLIIHEYVVMFSRCGFVMVHLACVGRLWRNRRDNIKFGPFSTNPELEKLQREQW